MWRGTQNEQGNWASLKHSVMPLLLLRLTVLFYAIILADSTNVSNDEYFVDHIFATYGNKGVLTFEGLEHLLENLGLGGIRFDETHNVSSHKTQDGGFEEIHDKLKVHVHEHQRNKRSVLGKFKKEKEKCLKPSELLNIFGLKSDHDVKISPSGFLQICPAIVYQLDRKVCAEKINFNYKPPSEKSYLVWIYGITSVLVMSITGLAGVIIVPCFEKRLFNKVLSVLAALATGTLSGDALLHLIPHALRGGNENTIVLRSSATFMTMMFFFIMEAIIHAKKRLHDTEKGVEKGTDIPLEPHNHSHEAKSASAVAWMVITGDGLHNLTDGLAIGAAFGQDPITGLATSLAVFTHELPHELGDFAILLKTGMSVKRAILYNISSSVLSLFGVLLGLWLGEHGEASLWIYSATAGSFLYISLATLVPEMHKQATSMGHTILQLGGMFAGGAIMFIIALYEHDLHEALIGHA